MSRLTDRVQEGHGTSVAAPDGRFLSILFVVSVFELFIVELLHFKKVRFLVGILEMILSVFLMIVLLKKPAYYRNIMNFILMTVFTMSFGGYFASFLAEMIPNSEFTILGVLLGAI